MTTITRDGRDFFFFIVSMEAQLCQCDEKKHLVSHYNEKPSGNNELLSQNKDLVSQNNELVSQNNELLSQK